MAKKKDQDVDEKDETESDGSLPVNDAWTGMLAISLLALMIGAGFLAWDYFLYKGDLPSPPKFVSPSPPKSVDPPKPSPPEKKDNGDMDKKDDEKKDASLRWRQNENLEIAAMEFSAICERLPLARRASGILYRFPVAVS
jgi:hypothetical protein